LLQPHKIEENIKNLTLALGFDDRSGPVKYKISIIQAQQWDWTITPDLQ